MRTLLLLLLALPLLAAAEPAEAVPHVEMSADFEKLRWFPLPEELQRELLGL